MNIPSATLLTPGHEGTSARNPPLVLVTAPHSPTSLASGLDGVLIVDGGPDHVGRRYLCRVWDRRAKGYRSKRFDGVAEAKRWARGTRDAFGAGLSMAGRLPAASVLPDYLACLRARGDGEAHVRAMERILGSVDVDLRADDAGEVIERALASATDGRSRLVDDPRSLRASTRRRMAQCWSSFGSWAVERRFLPRNPFNALASPKVPKVLQPFFLPSECRLLVSDAALAHPVGLIVALSIYTGLRLREAAWMRWDRIDWANSKILVRLPDGEDHREASSLGIDTTAAADDDAWLRVKGNRERAAILEPELAAIMRPLMGTGYVFPSAFRLALRGGQHYRRQLGYLCRAVGVVKGNRRWHSLRNSNAAMLRAAGVSPDKLMVSLGHDSPSMWARYSDGASRIEGECKGWSGHIRLRPGSAL